jgi:hypothetical protein
MKKINIFCLAVMIMMIAISSKNLYSYDRVYFNVGLSLNPIFNIYHDDLDEANSSFFDQLKEVDFGYDLRMYATVSSQILIGAGVSAFTTSTDSKNITGRDYEKTGTTLITGSITNMEVIYYFNRITDGCFLKIGSGIGDIAISKTNHKDKLRSEIGVGVKSGVGYAFTINEKESAFLVGLDYIYISAPYMRDYDKKLNFALSTFLLYVGIMW